MVAQPKKSGLLALGPMVRLAAAGGQADVHLDPEVHHVPLTS